MIELGYPVDHVGDRLAKRGFDLGLGDAGVLHHVMEERSGEPLRIKTPLRQDARYREGMSDVGLARLAKLSLVCFLGKGERALDQRDVRSLEIVTKVPGEFGDFRHT